MEIHDPSMLDASLCSPSPLAPMLEGLTRGRKQSGGRTSRDSVPTAHHRAAGERSLALAVLVDAIRCLTGRTRSGRNRSQLAAEAREWVTEHDPSWPFSFDNVCEELGLAAERLRARLLDAASELPPPDRDENRRRSPALRPREEDIVRMIRAGNPLRVVASTFGISVPQVSTLSGRLASRIRAERDADIRRLHAEGWNYGALAARFNLSRLRIRRICRRGRHELPAE